MDRCVSFSSYQAPFSQHQQFLTNSDPAPKNSSSSEYVHSSTLDDDTYLSIEWDARAPIARRTASGISGYAEVAVDRSILGRSAMSRSPIFTLGLRRGWASKAGRRSVEFEFDSWWLQTYASPGANLVAKTLQSRLSLCIDQASSSWPMFTSFGKS